MTKESLNGLTTIATCKWDTHTDYSFHCGVCGYDSGRVRSKIEACPKCETRKLSETLNELPKALQCRPRYEKDVHWIREYRRHYGPEKIGLKDAIDACVSAFNKSDSSEIPGNASDGIINVIQSMTEAERFQIDDEVSKVLRPAMKILSDILRDMHAPKREAQPAGEIPALLQRLHAIEQYAGSFIGCRCDTDECEPGDCWPCRMMHICELANPDDVKSLKREIGNRSEELPCDCCRKCERVRMEDEAARGFSPIRLMVCCPICGNKRCPKASDHDLACTGSNEPNQPGSVYQTEIEDAPPVRESGKRTLRDEFLERPDIVELWEGFKCDNDQFGAGA